MSFDEPRFGVLEFKPEEKHIYDENILIEPNFEKKKYHHMAYNLKFLDIPHILSPKSCFIEALSNISFIFIFINFRLLNY